MTLDVHQVHQEVQKLKAHLRHLESLLLHPDVANHLSKIMARGREAIESYEASLGEQPGTVYKEATYSRVFKVLATLVSLVSCDSTALGFPEIYAGARGDIDINWKNEKFELLFTIPEKENEPIYYYIDDFGKIKTKGTIPDEKLDTCAFIIQSFL